MAFCRHLPAAEDRLPFDPQPVDRADRRHRWFIHAFPVIPAALTCTIRMTDRQLLRRYRIQHISLPVRPARLEIGPCTGDQCRQGKKERDDHKRHSLHEQLSSAAVPAALILLYRFCGFRKTHLPQLLSLIFIETVTEGRRLRIMRDQDDQAASLRRLTQQSPHHGHQRCQV